MPHPTFSFSPADTPLLDRSVGELVAERPGRSRIFHAFGIDFCCQGGRTLRQACETKALPVQTLLDELETEMSEQTPAIPNPAKLPADKLCEYIVDTHHGFLRREFPRLRAMSERVARVHGGHTPSLIELFEIYMQLEHELASHMFKEEQILFPAIHAMCRGETAMSLDGPIACMIHEHDAAGSFVARIRELTHGFQPPADACNTYRALFAGLNDLETDLHRHIHLENHVLFPAAHAMAEGHAA